MGISRPNFYHDEPLFGLDIGNSSLKVMQIAKVGGKTPKVLGYGVSAFYPSDTTVQGVIKKPEILSDALYKVLKEGLSGEISTRRVACTKPTAHTFSRLMKVPLLETQELSEAVQLEVEQFIPMPVDKLTVAYEISSKNANGMDVLMVATPKVIVDSYVDFLESVDLEPVALEPSMNATARLFSMSNPAKNQPSILVDFGSVAADVAVIDQTVFVNSTVPGGSDTLAELLAKKLSISRAEAMDMKNELGIGDSENHQKMMDIAKPMLDALVNEVKKIVRYYNERAGQKPHEISQLVLIGGGSTMPGLSDYLSSALNMQPKVLDPWNKLDFTGIKPLVEMQKSMYITVAGEAILDPQEIFA
jgi:type IV pilus assembly protein PilM